MKKRDLLRIYLWMNFWYTIDNYLSLKFRHYLVLILPKLQVRNNGWNIMY